MLIKQFLIIGTQRQREKGKNVFPIPLLNQHVMLALSTRNLAVIFDVKFTPRFTHSKPLLSALASCPISYHL